MKELDRRESAAKVLVARLESPNGSPIVTDDLHEVGDIVMNMLANLDPVDPHRNRISVGLRLMDAKEFRGLPSHYGAQDVGVRQLPE